MRKGLDGKKKHTYIVELGASLVLDPEGDDTRHAQRAQSRNADTKRNDLYINISGKERSTYASIVYALVVWIE
jgi:hypothetical protein